MKVALNEPMLEEATDVGDVVCVVPSYFMVMVEEAAKPVPDTVTVEPTIVLVGLRLVAALTVKMLEAVCGDTSVAVTLCAPFVDTGVAKVALNEPMLEEATDVGDVVCVVPSYFMVMVEEAAKPAPVTVTVVAAAPPGGLSVMEAVTEKVAEAVCDDASVAVTVCPPKVAAGTVKKAENRPELSVVTVATVEEPNVIVTVEVDEKLVPETITGEPTTSDVGFRLIPGLRVKVAEAECENTSVAVTMCAPSVETGTVNVALKEPVPPVLEVPMVIESNVTVTTADPPKPDPVTVNEEPD